VAAAREDGNAAVLAKLLEIGSPPYKNHIVERQADAAEKGLSDRAVHQMTRLHFISLALLSPYYSLADDVRMLLGIPRSGLCLEKEIYSANLLTAVPEIDVPVYFFEGRYDTVLSPILVERYYRELKAPRGKRLVWFEHSDHWLHLEEREKYRAALRECLLGKSR
jgi:pimeloyl-ACP methyl ester carboxylesterase